jgi:hypothetical protein
MARTKAGAPGTSPSPLFEFPPRQSNVRIARHGSEHVPEQGPDGKRAFAAPLFRQEAQIGVAQVKRIEPVGVMAGHLKLLFPTGDIGSIA